jgi:hypothetical protein
MRHLLFCVKMGVLIQENSMKQMKQSKNKLFPLYTLWLPITSFRALRKNFKSCEKLQEREDETNSNWSWLVFEYGEVVITVDSLGFFYLDKITSQEQKREVLALLYALLNSETIINIEETFLNKQIGYDAKEENAFVAFLENIAIGFEEIIDKVKLEYIYSHLYVDLTKQSEVNKDKKYKISSVKEMKFSLETNNSEHLESNFQTILNRNFKKILEKSIYYTHSLDFEKGEVYELSIIHENCKKIADFVNFELFINDSDQSKIRDKLFCQVLKKAIQDTIEERTILHFLRQTRQRYLNAITEEINRKNTLLKKLNSYLLDDVEKSFDVSERLSGSSEDESAVEMFIQNLLQVIPKFHMIDSKLKEAYYVKVGNTTTNLQVNEGETIVNTLYYGKWKGSVNLFINTASKVSESLTMYHQNKTLRELEDISYNANYQADIEDIRELQKNRAIALDEGTKSILFYVTIAALAGEAPIFQSKLLFFTSSEPFSFVDAIWTNGIDVVSNSILYFVILSVLIGSFIAEPQSLNGKRKHSPWYLRPRKFVEKWKLKRKRLKEYAFEESDYDKHEYRSNKLLLSYNQSDKLFEKHPIEYNHALSSYALISALKEVEMTQMAAENLFRFELFPQLLKETPIAADQEYIYRENYRISGNDRVAVKLMYRYKINDLSLERFLTYLKEDAFMQGYEKHLEKQGLSLKKQYEVLSDSVENDVHLTLYIVYSFVLKFDKITKENIYHYTIYKDQYRVHYHINKLLYKNREDFEKKQEALAQLVDIYFLTRLKKIEV